MFGSTNERVLKFSLGMLGDPAVLMLIKKCQFKTVLLRNFLGDSM